MLERLGLRRRNEIQLINYKSSKISHSDEAFSPQVEQSRELQQAFEDTLAHLAVVPPAQHLNMGNDHVVGKATVNGKPYVFKELRGTSREILAFGHSIEPHRLPLTGSDQRPEIDEKKELDLPAIVNAMKLRHWMAMTHLDLGEDVLAPTAFKVIDDKIYRIQPYIPHPTVDHTEIHLRNFRMYMLYEELHKRWHTMLGSPDFFKMPEPVQTFSRYFYPDPGSGSNAIFLGLGSKPEFKVVDY